MILQVIAAFFGTMAFALLFGVPASCYGPAGAVGAVGWLIYCLMSQFGIGMEFAVFFATAAVVVAARLCAVYYECPNTTFLIPGIFPLVPGGGVYWTSYYLVRGYYSIAAMRGFEAVRCAFCIVFGIVIVLELPGRWFTWAGRLHKKSKE